VRLETVDTPDERDENAFDEPNEYSFKRIKFSGRKLADLTPEELEDPQIVEFKEKLDEKERNRSKQESDENEEAENEEQEQESESPDSNVCKV
jgi:hypothetical protein